jgi:hypothetical protein
MGTWKQPPLGDVTDGIGYSLLKEETERGGGVSLPLRLMSSSLVMSLLVSSEDTGYQLNVLSFLHCILTVFPTPHPAQGAEVTLTFTLQWLPTTPATYRLSWKYGCHHSPLSTETANRSLPGTLYHKGMGHGKFSTKWNPSHRRVSFPSADSSVVLSQGQSDLPGAVRPPRGH